MWQKPCPICGRELRKEQATDTVHCPCGRYTWKG